MTKELEEETSQARKHRGSLHERHRPWKGNRHAVERGEGPKENAEFLQHKEYFSFHHGGHQGGAPETVCIGHLHGGQ